MRTSEEVVNMSSLEFECLEPELKERMHLLADGDLDSETREHLERHLAACHACREQAQFEEFVAGNLKSSLPSRKGREYAVRWTGVLAAGLVAALILIFLLPPGPEWTLNGTELWRQVASATSDDFRIVSPLEGEVVRDQRAMTIKWTPVPSARSYDVNVIGVEGQNGRGLPWSRNVRSCAVTLPDSLIGVGTFQAIIKPLPEGLVDCAEKSVEFKRRELPHFIAYRLKHPPVISLALLALSLVAGTALVLRRR